MTEGVIIRGLGGFYDVETERGVAQCRARGRFRKDGVRPYIGDRVLIRIANEHPLQGFVEEILPRKSLLLRPAVANVDTVAVVAAAVSPVPDLFLIDKLIAMARLAGIKALVVANKTDLASPRELLAIYEKAGFPVFGVCAATGEGIGGLLQCISKGTTALAGNSGVGKSSLLNAFGFSAETGDVSRIQRGRHTTRHVELFSLEGGGYVVDTPGFSVLEPEGIAPSQLKNLFQEFESLPPCRFPDCDHIGARAKDCAVRAAAEAGEIPPSRYESYRRLYAMLKDAAAW